MPWVLLVVVVVVVDEEEEEEGKRLGISSPKQSLWP